MRTSALFVIVTYVTLKTTQQSMSSNNEKFLSRKIQRVTNLFVIWVSSFVYFSLCGKLCFSKKNKFMATSIQFQLSHFWHLTFCKIIFGSFIWKWNILFIESGRMGFVIKTQLSEWIFSIPLQKGQGYFYKRREKYKCTVFKVNMGVKGIHICDKKGISVLFNVEKVSIIYLFITCLLIGK